MSKREETLYWAKDSSTKCCIQCTASFTLLSRRHHCRSCGEIFCENCSSYTCIIPSTGTEATSKRRVCKSCNEVLKKVLAVPVESVSGEPTPKDPQQQKSVAAAYTGIPLPTSKDSAIEEFRIYLYSIALHTQLPFLLHQHMYATKAGNMLSVLEELKRKISSDATTVNNASMATSAATEGSPLATSPSSQAKDGSPTPRNYSLGGGETENLSFFGEPSATGKNIIASATLYDAATQSERMCTQYNSRSRHAISLLQVMQRKSLSNFFHHLHTQLVIIFLSHRLFELARKSQVPIATTPTNSSAQQVTPTTENTASNKSRSGSPETSVNKRGGLPPQQQKISTAKGSSKSLLQQFSNLEFHGVSLSTLIPVISRHFFDQLELFDCHCPDDIAEKAIDSLQSLALEITRRYEEQICSLTEYGAITLAESVLVRILAGSTKVCKKQMEGEKSVTASNTTTPVNTASGAGISVSLFDFFCECALKEHPSQLSLSDQQLETRISEIDVAWTDHGALTQCGVRTEDALFFDPILMDDPTCPIAKYYYRLGTVAEATALNMHCTGKNRHSKSPIWLLARQFEEHQSVVAERDRRYASYASCSFASPDQRCWVNNTEAEQVIIAKNALQLVKDFIANRPLFFRMLSSHYEAHGREIEGINVAIEHLQERVEDVATGAYVSLESQSYLRSLEGMTETADPGHRHKAAMFDKFRKLLKTPHQSMLDFYAYIRLKLLSALLCATFKELEGQETLLGSQVFMRTDVRSIVDYLVSHAQNNQTTQFWCTADVVDKHSEAIARAITERYSNALSMMTESALICFADCCIARYLVLLRLYPVEVVACVNIVNKLGEVQLNNSLVNCDKVYLPRRGGFGTLCEHSIHNKSGLLTTKGEKYCGRMETNKIHHKPQKYGYILCWHEEAIQKKLEKADENWVLPPLPQKPRSRLSFFSWRSKPPAQPPIMIKSKESSELHWGSSMVSVGPRMIAAGEKVGVTVQPRNRNNEQVACTHTVHFRMLTCKMTEGVIEPATKENEIQSPASDDVSSKAESTTHHSAVNLTHTFACDHAGGNVVGALVKGVLLVGNLVTVRSTVVDWAAKSTLDVEPSRCAAGRTMTCTISLRDRFGNLTSSTGPEDFAISVQNDTDLVPSPVRELENGTFAFEFTPVVEGVVHVAVTVGGVTLKFPTPLRCTAADVDFKNALLSFDEVEVEAGQTVHGNLLLRDMYGNRVAQDDEQVLIELINGGRSTLAATKVHGGEYIFSFAPTRQGTAIVRATSRKSADSVIARVHVAVPQTVDWLKTSVVSCMSKEVFAGEQACFHIITKDSYYNAVTGCVPEDFQCQIHFSEDGSQLESTPVQGVAPSFSFSARPTRRGTMVAEVIYKGLTKVCHPVSVSAAALCWERSRLQLPATAVVGEWVAVQIECFDEFGNPTPAHAGDFSVSVANESFVGNAKKVEGAGCCFGFQFVLTKTGEAKVSVTYAGRSTRTRSLLMLAAPGQWTTSSISCVQKEVVCGSAVWIKVKFRDTYGNAAQKWDGKRLKTRIVNENIEEIIDALPNQGEGEEKTEGVKEEDTNAIPMECVAEFSELVYQYIPKKAGHLHAVLTLTEVGGDESDSKQTTSILVHPAPPDWTSCTFESSHPQVIAGLPVAITLTVLDTFGNWADTGKLDLEFKALNRKAGSGRESCKELPLKPIENPKPGCLVMHCVPEIAGEIFLRVENKDANLLHEEERVKELQCTVENSEIDWLGKTKATANDVTVGEEMLAIVYLLDSFENPIKDIDVSRFDAVICNAPKPSEVVPLSVLNEGDASVLCCRYTPTVASNVSIVLRLQQVEKPALLVNVRAGPCSWSHCTLEWPTPALEAGVESSCAIVFRDRFSNVTQDQVPSADQLQSKVHWEGSSRNGEAQEEEIPSSFRTEGDAQALAISLFLIFTSKRSGILRVSLRSANHQKDAESEVLYSCLILVEPSQLSWANSILAVEPSKMSDGGNGKDKKKEDVPPTIAAGERARFTLALRDVFDNPAMGIAVPTDFDIRVSHDEDVDVNLEEIGLQIEPFQKSTLHEELLSLNKVPPSAESGTVTPSQLPLPHNSGASADETKSMTSKTDANSSSKFLSSGKEAAVIPCEDATVWCFSFYPKLSGTYAFSVSNASQRDDDGVFSEKVFVQTSSVHWPDNCKIQVDSEMAVAGSTIFYTLDLHDRFGNSSIRGMDPLQVEFSFWYASNLNQSTSAGTPMKEGRSTEEFEALAPSGPLISLPQGSGSYGISFEPTQVGLIRCAASYQGKLLECPDTLHVTCGEVCWEKCSLALQDEAATVDCDIIASVVFCDRYGNVIGKSGANSSSDNPSLSSPGSFADPTQLSQLVDHRNEYKLITATGKNNCEGINVKFDCHTGQLEARPLKTGQLELMISHSESSDIVHKAVCDVLSGGLSTAFGKLLCVPSVVSAGEACDITFQLQDKYNNLVGGIEATEFDCHCFVQPVNEEGNASGTVIPTNCAIIVDTHASAFSCHCQPKKAGIMKLEIFAKSSENSSSNAPATATSSSVGGQKQVFVQCEVKIIPNSIHPKGCVIQNHSQTSRCFAGTAHSFLVQLADMFGNRVEALPAQSSLFRFTSTNGTAQPAVQLISSSTAPESGCVMLECVPREVGTLVVHMDFDVKQLHTPSSSDSRHGSLHESGSPEPSHRVSGWLSIHSPQIEVIPALMDWESTQIKIVDEIIKLGNESNIVITPKDCFGNSVAAKSEDFKLTIYNNTEEVEHDELIGTKSFLVPFKPLKKGTVVAEVFYLKGEGEMRRKSNTVQVL